MAWTMLWTIAAVGYLALHVRLDPAARGRGSWRAFAWFLAGALAVKFCVLDTLAWWLGDRAIAVTPLLNVQMFTALVVVAGLAIVHWIIGRHQDDGANDAEATPWRVALSALAL